MSTRTAQTCAPSPPGPLPLAMAPNREWDWWSGPCVALEHSFELYVEPRGMRVDLETMVGPFRSQGPLHARSLRYEVRAEETEYGPYALYVGEEQLASGSHVTSLTGGLAWHINRSVIESSVDSYVLMHAAAATRAGITVILPADMECGKTTTVAGLLRSGFDYVTDEGVAIDPVTGWVTPFPKTLSLDPGSWTLFPECAPVDDGRVRRQWHVPAQWLGARAVRGPVPPPRVIVFPRYTAGADTAVVPISRAEAVRELARMTFSFPGHARRNLEVLSRVAAQATVTRLVIGSLDQAVDAIEELVSQRILEDL